MKVFPCIYLSLILSFLLGVHEGKLALWRENAVQPEMVFPCPVEMLPEADRQALRNGIRIDSREDLARLLEDYLS